MPFIDANGVSLHYRRLGAGPPLPLEAVRCPVHPLCAAEDILSPPPTHLDFHREHRSGEHAFAAPRVIDGAAHSLHWERPDAVIAHVRGALGT